MTSGKSIIIEPKKRINGCQGKGIEVTFSTVGHQEILWGGKTVLCLNCGGSYTAMCVFQNRQNGTSKMVNLG